MQIEVALRGRRAAPTTLSCNGNVAFRELEHAALNGQEPFQVLGNQLTAERLDTDALVTIRGAATGEPKAEIRARGMTVLAADVKMDVGQNRIWIDGPGVANMQMKRDLSGRVSSTPTPLELSWLGGMVFDGRTILIQRQVRGEGPDDRLRCDELAVRLTSNVDFGKRVDQNAIDVAEVECRGAVVMDHKSRDEVGVTSHERMKLERLSVNQQTGAIHGDGPGVIRSTHFADQLSAFAGPAHRGHRAGTNQATPSCTFYESSFSRDSRETSSTARSNF